MQETIQRPRHVLTAAEGMRGANASKAVRSLKKHFHYEKALKKLGIEGATAAELIKVLQVALSSPVISGTIAYGAVAIVENLVKQSSPSQQQQQSTQTTNDLLKTLANLLPTNWNPLQALASGANALGDLGIDFIALKTAIILYIASGGNLAGLLTSSGNVLSTLLKSGAAVTTVT